MNDPTSDAWQLPPSDYSPLEFHTQDRDQLEIEIRIVEIKLEWIRQDFAGRFKQKVTKETKV